MTTELKNMVDAGLIKRVARNERYVIDRNGNVYDTQPRKIEPCDTVCEYGRLVKKVLMGRKREYWAINMRLPDGRQTMVKISRLMAEAFIPKKDGDGDIVRHLNENETPRSDSIDNLAWGTPQDNSDDRIRNGNSCRGDKHPLAKLSDMDVLKIRFMRQECGTKLGVFAREFGVSQSSISVICSGKSRNYQFEVANTK